VGGGAGRGTSAYIRNVCACALQDVGVILCDCWQRGLSNGG
jgi:hypothetical protein